MPRQEDNPAHGQADQAPRDFTKATRSTVDVVFAEPPLIRPGSFTLTRATRLRDLYGNGFLSRLEFAALWTQFWISDDPGEPGNLMCGPVTGTPAA
ncbi:hypothetical protein ACFVJI_24100 [Streptomyces sp. NPDC127584]|uniref:hypothetical protein n=1 Tax=Streptomyces sp. NPDC127584 TaxID=3345403 RepID=UPI00363D6BBF